LRDPITIEKGGPMSDVEKGDAECLVACTPCEGTGRMRGRPCPFCTGTGKLPDVAEDPDADDTEEIVAWPWDGG